MARVCYTHDPGNSRLYQAKYIMYSLRNTYLELFLLNIRRYKGIIDRCA